MRRAAIFFVGLSVLLTCLVGRTEAFAAKKSTLADDFQNRYATGIGYWFVCSATFDGKSAGDFVVMAVSAPSAASTVQATIAAANLEKTKHNYPDGVSKKEAYYIADVSVFCERK